MTAVAPDEEMDALANPGTVAWHGRSLETTCAAIVGIGVMLNAVQYLANSSFFLDEAAIASSLLSRGSLSELFNALDYGQTAPPGFLLVEYAAVRAFGPGEHGLRLYSFVMGVVSLLLFWRLSRRTLAGFGQVIALGFFSTSNYLVYFSANAKPYTGDVAFTVMLLLLAWHTLHRPVTRGWMGGLIVAGVTATWFSQPQVLVVASLAVGLGWVLLRERPAEEAKRFAVVVAAWAASSIVIYVLARSQLTQDSHAYFSAFWATGFVPRELSPGLTVWLLGVYAVFFGGLVFSPPAGLFFFFGCFALFRNDRAWGWLLVLPVFAAFAASATRLYPLGTHSPAGARVSLFLLPIVVLVIGAGTDFVRRRYRLNRGLSVLVVLLLLAFPVSRFTSGFPFHREHTRQVLTYVASMTEPGDAIYVDYSVRPTFDYYAPRLGLDDHPRYYALCSRASWRDYLSGLRSAPSYNRVWFIYSSTFFIDGVNEKEPIIRLLDRHGELLDSVRSPAPNVFNAAATSALLYEVKAGATEIEVSMLGPFPQDRVPDAIPEFAAWSCHGTLGPPSPTNTGRAGNEG